MSKRTADGYAKSASRGDGLQLDNRLRDAKPDELTVMIAAFEHLIGTTGKKPLSDQNPIAANPARRTL
jgi:hypothetical protein